MQSVVQAIALSLFQRKQIRTDYLAGLPRAIRAFSHAQKRIALGSRTCCSSLGTFLSRELRCMRNGRVIYLVTNVGW